jgi:hypothetical protein
MMAVARVAAFHALVLWILRLAHATDGKPAYVRQKAHQGRPRLAMDGVWIGSKETCSECPLL